MVISCLKPVSNSFQGSGQINGSYGVAASDYVRDGTACRSLTVFRGYRLKHQQVKNAMGIIAYIRVTTVHHDVSDNLGFYFFFSGQTGTQLRRS